MIVYVLYAYVVYSPESTVPSGTVLGISDRYISKALAVSGVTKQEKRTAQGMYCSRSMHHYTHHNTNLQPHGSPCR